MIPPFLSMLNTALYLTKNSFDILVERLSATTITSSRPFIKLMPNSSFLVIGRNFDPKFQICSCFVSPCFTTGIPKGLFTGGAAISAISSTAPGISPVDDVDLNTPSEVLTPFWRTTSAVPPIIVSSAVGIVCLIKGSVSLVASESNFPV